MDDIFSLAGKTILVTGASSGIGRAAAIRASASGAGVCITGRDEARLLETLAAMQGEGHRHFVADLADEARIDGLVESLPQLDGVVHSAGIPGLLPVKFIRKQHIDRVSAINFEAPVLITARLLSRKKLNDNASLVFLCTLATKDPIMGGALYGGTKAALEAYMRVLSVELAPRRIRANCISPAYVNTPMTGDIGPEDRERFGKLYPLGWGEPEDVADAVIFFLSAASRWVTGATLPMGGC